MDRKLLEEAKRSAQQRSLKKTEAAVAGRNEDEVSKERVAVKSAEGVKSPRVPSKNSSRDR
jgi:hypothetical protein